MGPTITAAIIIPARNEELRIGDCLRAIFRQQKPDTSVVVVANNCTDRTADVARTCAAEASANIDVLECTLNEGDGVGTARQIGVTHALETLPDLTHILTTDADCRVADDWVARNRHHLSDVAAVCGLVTPMRSEISVLSKIETAPAEMEGQYEQLVLAFYQKFCGIPHAFDGTHGCAAGASLAIRVDSYRSVGGFADIATGEDRDLVRRLKMSGHRVRHAGDIRVEASCRLDGRATGGMAAALRDRVDRNDYLIDDALPPSGVLIEMARCGRLGAWPLQVAQKDRLRARDLAPHIAVLQAALDTRQIEVPDYLQPGAARRAG